MITFPIAYFIAFFPLGIERLVYLLSGGVVDFPQIYTAVGICCFVLNGTLNSILYGYTRNLFCKIRNTTTTLDENKSERTSGNLLPLPYE